MSSIIEMEVVSESGVILAKTRYCVEYGNELQRVIVVVSGDEVEVPSASVELFRDVNEMLVDQSIVIDMGDEEYDA